MSKKVAKPEAKNENSSSVKPAYFKKVFSFKIDGETPSDKDLSNLTSELEKHGLTLCNVNEKFRPNENIADVFEKLSASCEIEDGQLFITLNVKHKNSSIKYIQDKINSLVSQSLSSAKVKFSKAMSAKLAKTKKSAVQPPKQPVKKPVKKQSKALFEKNKIIEPKSESEAESVPKPNTANNTDVDSDTDSDSGSNSSSAVENLEADPELVAEYKDVDGNKQDEILDFPDITEESLKTLPEREDNVEINQESKSLPNPSAVPAKAKKTKFPSQIRQDVHHENLNNNNDDDNDDTASIDSDIYREEYKLWKLCTKQSAKARAEAKQGKKVLPSRKSKKLDPIEEKEEESDGIPLSKESILSFIAGFVAGGVLSRR